MQNILCMRAFTGEGAAPPSPVNQESPRRDKWGIFMKLCQAATEQAWQCVKVPDDNHLFLV